MKPMEDELEALRAGAQATKQKLESLQAEANAAHDHAANAQEASSAADTKARADMKVPRRPSLIFSGGKMRKMSCPCHDRCCVADLPGRSLCRLGSRISAFT